MISSGVFTSNLKYDLHHPTSFCGSDFLSPVNVVDGGYRNSQRPSVRHSVRHSVRPSVRPSVTNESPVTATIFHRSLPNLYSMFIPMKNFIICSFIKKWQKLWPWQPFFFLSFNAYLPMSLPYMKA